MDARILLFLPDLSGGGAERVIVQLANEFALAGYEIHLAVADSVNTDYLAEISENVSLHLLNSSRVMQAVPKLSALLKHLQPAVLLTTMGHAAIACYCALLLSGYKQTKFFVREAISVEYKLAHMSRFKGRLMDWCVKQVYRQADAVVSPSTRLMQDLVEHYDLKNRALVIANPVLVDTFQSQLMAASDLQLPWGDEAIVVIGVGRLNKQKDFSTLIRAFAGLPASNNCRLLILGEGTERRTLEQLVLELDLEDRCWLPGFVQNPLPYLYKAQVFVLSSRYEGLPNVLIQAYAAGAVCVSTDCPTGPEEILEKGRLGRLVPVGDVQTMTAAISGALDDAKIDSGRRSAQFSRFNQRYNSGHIARQYLTLMQLPEKSSSADAVG